MQSLLPNTLVRGMRDPDGRTGRIAELQKALKNRGTYPGRVDGYYGPVTQGGMIQYQQDTGQRTNGQASKDVQASLGLDAQAGLNLTDYTSGDEDTRFNGLPGQPEIWLNKDTGVAYVVYEIPGTDPPIPIMFAVPSQQDLESFFGDDDVAYDRQMTQDQIDSTGGLPFGTSDNIDPDLPGNPWAGFLDRIDRAIEVQPWLEDPEVFALYAGAWLEGRDVEEWELQTTDWWQGLNSDQRSWISLQAGDPSEAERILEDNYLAVFSQFQALGVAEPNAAMVEYMANEWTYGNWSQAYLQEQIFNVTGLDSGANPLDTGLSDFLDENEIDRESGVLMENRVRDMFNRWLGPSFQPSTDQLAQWSDRYRRSPEAAQDELTNYLRQQRLALYPTYTDPSLTYEDIAAPWRSFAQNLWGQRIDETSGTFQKVLAANDATEAGRILRRDGLSQGVEGVTEDALATLRTSTGMSQVVNPI